MGNSLKVTPVLEAGATHVKSYFPSGSWVSMKNYSDMVIIDAKLAGQWIDLPAPNTVNDTVNVHLRPGSMTLKQDNSN